MLQKNLEAIKANIKKDKEAYEQYITAHKIRGWLCRMSLGIFKRDGNMFSILGGVVISLGLSDVLVSVGDYPTHFAYMGIARQTHENFL